MKKLNGLTILRGVFALYVIVFHVFIRQPFDMPIVSNLLNNGAVSMSFFFILSGFVLAYVYYGKNISSSTFIKRRISRIYPTYALYGVLILPIMLQLPIKEFFAALLTFITATQSWLVGARNFAGFSGDWTVSTEIALYLSFPLIFIPIINNTKKWLFISFAVTSLLVPISLALSGKDIGSTYIYYSNPIYRLPEFIIGICLGVMFLKGVRVNGWVCLLLFAVFLIGLNLKDNYAYIRYNFFFVPFLGALILYCANLDFNPNKNKFISSMMYFGEISYSFYLMQIVLFIYMGKLGITFSNIFIIDVIVFIVANFVLSAACHYLTEGNGRVLVVNFFKKQFWKSEQS